MYTISLLIHNNPTDFENDGMIRNTKIKYLKNRTCLYLEINKFSNCVSKTTFSEVFIFSGG